MIDDRFIICYVRKCINLLVSSICIIRSLFYSRVQSIVSMSFLRQIHVTTAPQGKTGTDTIPYGHVWSDTPSSRGTVRWRICSVLR